MTKKMLLIAASAVAGLLGVVVLSLWLFLDANQFRPQLEAAMGGALGRKVSIGDLRIAPFSGGMAIDDLSIADDPAFSAEPFVTAKAVSVGVDLMPLIFSRRLHVRSFRLDAPQVILLNSPSGEWNFSGLGDSSPRTSSAGATAAMRIVIETLEIAGGRILVGEPGARGKQRVYENVNLEVSDLSLTSEFPFRATAKTPGGGSVTLGGTAGPLNLADVADTPFQAAVDVSHLDVASTGFIDPASGLAGLVDFKGALASEGGRLTSRGSVNAVDVQLVPGAARARAPIRIEYESDYTRKTQTGTLKQGDVHVGKAVAHLTGEYSAAGEAFAVRLMLIGSRMPAHDLEAVLPAVGMMLPSGASLEDGTVNVNLTIRGPVDRLVIAGPISLANATVAGFDLVGKLGALPSFSGAPLDHGANATLIETLAATFRVAPDGIRAESLHIVAPALGTLSGGGTIAPQGRLDFKMLAKLTSSGAMGQLSRVGSFGPPANGIPFRIQGTTANPVFVPDVGRAVGEAVEGFVNNPDTAKKAAGALRGLFGGRKD